MSRGGANRLPKVALGYCHPAEVSAFWMTSVLRLFRETRHINDVIAVYSGPKIDSARNSIARQFRASNCDYLFMVDTDMVFPHDSIPRLLAHKKDIVGGLCFSGGFQDKKLIPTLRILGENEEGKPTFQPMWDYPKNELVQVTATGAACMMISREVIETVEDARGKDHTHPWFAHGAHNGVEIGEDIAFCVTAGKLGFEVWVDTSLDVGHVKPHFLNEALYDSQRSNDDNGS